MSVRLVVPLCVGGGAVRDQAAAWSAGAAGDLAGAAGLQALGAAFGGGHCDSNHHDLHTGDTVLRLEDGRRLGPHGWLPSQPPPDSG